MSDREPKSEAREEAIKALRATWLSSVVKSFVATAALIATLAAISGMLVALKEFSDQIFDVFIVVSVVWFFVCLIFFELLRHQVSTALLKNLINDEKFYENIISNLKKERDDYKTQIDVLKVEWQIFLRSVEVTKKPKGSGEEGSDK